MGDIGSAIEGIRQELSPQPMGTVWDAVSAILPFVLRKDVSLKIVFIERREQKSRNPIW
jgi:hypothetical protein